MTGGIGSGKSLALSILQRKGIPVLSADEVGHRLLRRAVISHKIRRAFGKCVGDARGRIDRKKLAAVVFTSRRRVKKLNQILHPAIRAEIRAWIKARKRRTIARLLAVEVPLLFESRFTGLFDGVLSISAPARFKRRRVGSKRFGERARFQWSQTRTDRRADWVVRNISTRSALRRSLESWIRSLKLDKPS
jgi:dephospho-CoA kinase